MPARISRSAQNQNSTTREIPPAILDVRTLAENSVTATDFLRQSKRKITYNTGSLLNQSAVNYRSATSTSEIVTSLPANWYCDDAIFNREKKLIFDREWLPLGPVDRLREIGDWFSTELTSASVIVSKSGPATDDIRVFHNVCRHRSAPIVDQDCGHSRRFVCPYHGWVYEIDVAIRSTIWNGVVWACLSEETSSLHDWLGEVLSIASRFSSVDTLEYETVLCDSIAVNWKTYGDNSAEGYHLNFIHPALASSIAANSDIRACSNGEFVGFDIQYKTAENDDGDAGFWIYKFPGVLLHFSAHSFNLERVTPISANQIQLTRWFWFRKEVDQAVRDETIDASNQVMSEDIAICKKVQRNLNNGRMPRGVLSATREPGTVYLQQLVKQRLGSV